MDVIFVVIIIFLIFLIIFLYNDNHFIKIIAVMKVRFAQIEINKKRRKLAKEKIQRRLNAI